MMKRPVRRFGILVLAVALVPGQISTSDAGVIPWLYNSIFGPVGHYGYGGYGYISYYPYAYSGQQIGYMTPVAPMYSRQSKCGPGGCSPSYSVGYQPLFSSPAYCATGGCSPVLAGYRYSSGSCGTCTTVASATGTCSAKTSWKSKEAKTSWKSKEAKTEWKAEVVRGESAVPTPVTKDNAPSPKTFADGTADSTKGQSTAVEKVVTSGADAENADGKSAVADPNWNSTSKPAAKVATDGESAPGNIESAADAQPAAVEDKAGSAGFGKTLRGEESATTEGFEEPLKGVESAVEGDAVPEATPVLPEGLEELPLEPAKEAAPGLDVDSLPLDLENKSSWKFNVPVRRVAFRAGYGRATVARTSVDVDVNYVIPTAALRLVSR